MSETVNKFKAGDRLTFVRDGVLLYGTVSGIEFGVFDKEISSIKENIVVVVWDGGPLGLYQETMLNSPGSLIMKI